MVKWFGCIVLLSWAVACGEEAPVTADAGQDAGTPAEDAGPRDSGPPATDAGRDADAVGGDGGAATDAGQESGAHDGSAPTADGPPLHLADTGLYQEGSTELIADGVLAYTPRYTLWTDGAEKRRWLWLPLGETIDTSDMDSWVFPIGTKAWKQFDRDGKRIETRLLEKRQFGWEMIAYIWNDAQTQATASLEGMQDVMGTQHDVPSSVACGDCHVLRDKLAGVSAIQLSHEGPGLTLQQLAEDGRLSDPPAAGTDHRAPDTGAWDALGYLHANCGHCHQPNGAAFDKANGMQLWLTVDRLDAVSNTLSYMTTVGVADGDRAGDLDTRIMAGNAAMSSLVYRIEHTRGEEGAMPPLGVELVDQPNVDAIKTWINGL